MEPGETDGPLASLCARLLRVRPVVFSYLVSRTYEAEEYGSFVNLVTEYLPESHQEIMAEATIHGRVQAFANLFGQRYFPLADIFFEFEEIGELTRFIPVDVYGMDYDDYHYLTDNRLGHILSALLVNFEEPEGLVGEGVRVTLMEAAEKQVHREVLARIPQQGYPLDDLRQRLGRRYKGLLYEAEHLCHESSNDFLNVSDESFYSNPPEWDREMVEYLTKEWKGFLKIDKVIVDFWKWLEAKPAERLSTILNWLERPEGPETSPNQLRLI